MSHSHVRSRSEQLRLAGFRVTPARLAIADYLSDAHAPIGTLDLVKKFVPATCDSATLYRTLKSFEAKKLIRGVSLDRDFASYEWVHEGEEHHHHLICTRCGLIEEIPECDLEALEKRVLRGTSKFQKITSHSLEFFGHCTACGKKG